MTISNSEQELRDYLLGQLSPGQQDSLEERYFADDSLLDQLLGAETELVEDYVAGRLSPPTRAQFEHNYLTTEDKQERLELVRELQARAQSPARAKAATVAAPLTLALRAATPVQAGVLRSEPTPRQQKARPALTYGFLILLIGTVALSVYTISLRRRERAVEQELATLNRQRREELAKLSTEQKEAQRNLEAARGQAEALARALDATGRKPTPPDGSDAEVFSAAIGSSNADGGSTTMLAGPGPNTEHLAIPLPARVVRLTIRFPAREEFEDYFVSIAGADGSEVLSPQRARHSAAGSAVTTYVATKLLNKGSYVLTVTGHNRGATSQPVAMYRLEVAK